MSDHQEMMKKKFHSDNFQLVELKIRICKEIGKMKKISMQFILRIIAIVVFIGGAFIGYDVGRKMDLSLTLLYCIAYRKDIVFYETCRLGTACNARCPQMASPQKGSWRQPA